MEHKYKGILITGHEGPRGCGCKGPHIHSQGTRKRGLLVLSSAAFTPGKSPRCSFYRRLSGPQDQSGYERAKKNIHPSDTRDVTRGVQPAASALPLELLVQKKITALTLCRAISFVYRVVLVQKFLLLLLLYSRYKRNTVYTIKHYKGHSERNEPESGMCKQVIISLRV